jgi:multiple sugar transport system ATP-binding protein
VADISLRAVRKTYPGATAPALDGVSLDMAPGEFMVLVGPSGCGKSTLLRIIAGLEEPDAGAVFIGGRDVTGLESRKRDLAMVFQNYALYPHMTVRKNLGYGLKVRGVERQEIARRIAAAASLLGIEDLLERRPAQLSGGQRQRVAMGRAIVREPLAFLMDEPLSNLDAKLRVGMRAELAALHARLGISTVYVTHDQVEAMTLGTRVAVMRDGRILQVDDPETLYLRPANLFVAAFIGSPAMNLFDVVLDGDELAAPGLRLPLAPGRRPPVPEGTPLVVGIRPEDLQDAALEDHGEPTVDVSVAVVERLGSEAHVMFTGGVNGASGSHQGPERGRLFTASVDPATGARAGGVLRLALHPDRFHFFDAESGASLTNGSGR